jgi:hypothetical protein
MGTSHNGMNSISKATTKSELATKSPSHQVNNSICYLICVILQPIFIYRDAQDEQDKNMSNICAFILSILFIPVKLPSAWPESCGFEALAEDKH